MQASGRLDEHALRQRLLAGRSAWRVSPCGRQHSGPGRRPAWPVDGRLRHARAATRRRRARHRGDREHSCAGFHERIHDLLPGIEEERKHVSGPLPAPTPPHAGTDEPAFWFTCRDREEELVDFVRYVGTPGERRAAVVFQRPLPYLYLARSVFGAASQPYQALDSLPLAAEPFAAALDILFSFIVAEANRDIHRRSAQLAALAVRGAFGGIVVCSRRESTLSMDVFES